MKILHLFADMVLGIKAHLAKLLQMMIKPWHFLLHPLFFPSKCLAHYCSLWRGLRSGGSIGCNFCQRFGGQRI